MKDRNDPATIARCKETGKCQFIYVINIFLFTVSLYLAGTFKMYTMYCTKRNCLVLKIFIYTKRNYLVVNL